MVEIVARGGGDKANFPHCVIFTAVVVVAVAVMVVLTVAVVVVIVEVVVVGISMGHFD